MTEEVLARIAYLTGVMASSFLVVRLRGPFLLGFAATAAFGRFGAEPPILGDTEFLSITLVAVAAEALNLGVTAWRAVGAVPKPLGRPGWDVRGAARGTADDIVAGIGALVFFSAVLGRYMGPLVWEALMGYELLPRVPVSLRAMKLLVGATLFRWILLLLLSGYMASVSFADR